MLPTATGIFFSSAISTAFRSSPKSAMGAKVPGSLYWLAKLELVEAPIPITRSLTFTLSEIPPAEPIRIIWSTS